jgi:hypothetical protein
MTYTIFFTIVSIFVWLVVAIALILAAPGAKRPKHGDLK